jgi:hypothetical protein
LWLFVTHPLLNPWIGFGLVLIVLGLAAAIVLHTLLARPRPSEPTAQFVLQQIGNQLVMTGGFHSSDDLIKTLREAHNINPLPPPAAIVLGKATDDKQYRPLSQPEAEELQRQDEIGVKRMLLSEVESLKTALLSGRVAGGAGAAAEDTKPPSPKIP